LRTIANRQPGREDLSGRIVLDAVDDRSFELALELFLDGLIRRGP
jgi:hypothetical protein